MPCRSSRPIDGGPNSCPGCKAFMIGECRRPWPCSRGVSCLRSYLHPAPHPTLMVGMGRAEGTWSHWKGNDAADPLPWTIPISDQLLECDPRYSIAMFQTSLQRFVGRPSTARLKDAASVFGYSKKPWELFLLSLCHQERDFKIMWLERNRDGISFLCHLASEPFRCIWVTSNKAPI